MDDSQSVLTSVIYSLGIELMSGMGSFLLARLSRFI